MMLTDSPVDTGMEWTIDPVGTHGHCRLPSICSHPELTSTNAASFVWLRNFQFCAKEQVIKDYKDLSSWVYKNIIGVIYGTVWLAEAALEHWNKERLMMWLWDGRLVRNHHLLKARSSRLMVALILYHIFYQPLK